MNTTPDYFPKKTFIRYNTQRGPSTSVAAESSLVIKHLRLTSPSSKTNFTLRSAFGNVQGRA